MTLLTGLESVAEAMVRRLGSVPLTEAQAMLARWQNGSFTTIECSTFFSPTTNTSTAASLAKQAAKEISLEDGSFSVRL